MCRLGSYPQARGVDNFREGLATVGAKTTTMRNGGGGWAKLLSLPHSFAFVLDQTVLVGVELSHFSYDNNVLGAVETREKLDPHKNIVIWEDSESARHWRLTDWEFTCVRRSNPSPNIFCSPENC